MDRLSRQGGHPPSGHGSGHLQNIDLASRRRLGARRGAIAPTGSTRGLPEMRAADARALVLTPGPNPGTSLGRTPLNGATLNGAGHSRPVASANHHRGEVVMTTSSIIGSSRPRRSGGAVCEWVYDLTEHCTDALIERVDLSRQKAARGRGVGGGHGPLPGAAYPGGGRQDPVLRRVRDCEPVVQRLGIRRTEGPDRGSRPPSGPALLPVASTLRQRGGQVEQNLVLRGSYTWTPAPAVRACVDWPTRGRHAVAVVDGDVLVPAGDVATLARVDERAGRHR
jgi:hypothetical protein